MRNKHGPSSRKRAFAYLMSVTGIAIITLVLAAAAGFSPPASGAGINNVFEKTTDIVSNGLDPGRTAFVLPSDMGTAYYDVTFKLDTDTGPNLGMTAITIAGFLGNDLGRVPRYAMTNRGNPEIALVIYTSLVSDTAAPPIPTYRL